MPQNNTIQPLSTEVQEIISNKPGWLIRNGILLLLLVLCGIIGISYFIKYPDIVPANAKLTSINAPKPVVCINGGKLIKLLVAEGQEVKADEAIGYMESNASHTAVLELQQYLSGISQLLENNQAEKLQNGAAAYVHTESLGELQPSYQIFQQAFINFRSYISNGFYLRKKALLLADRQYLQKLFDNLNEQKLLQTEDMQLSEKTFAANESLKTDKVISEYDYRNERSKLIGKQLSLPQISSAIISNQSQQNDKLKEIMQLENEIAQQKSIFAQAVHTLQSQVEEWSRKYILKAPVGGTVSFAIFLQEAQQIAVNQTICYVNPGNSSYYAEMTIPQANFGKITTGQTVLLKFPSYPFPEFGALRGTIEFISRIPTDSGYIAKVVLPYGLHTNYEKDIQYRDGLIAKGEIITKDLRLLQRFYYSIAGQVNR